jgi:hypothetical protein
MARNFGLLAGLALLLLLAGASPALATTQACAAGPLVEHWDGNAWSQLPIADDGQLTAVAAVSTADVWAFGSEPVSDVVIDQPIAEHWDGSSWQSVSIPKPKGADEAYLVDATAASATNVWAVGYWSGSGPHGYRTLVEHWNGTAWKIVPSPSPLAGSQLSGVTAVSGQDVWAVGRLVAAFRPSHPSTTPLRTLVLHWNGAVWKRVKSPTPASSSRKGARRDASLADVDAVSARNVWAVGTYFRRARNGRHAYQTLVLHWNGTSWKKLPSANPGGVRHMNTLEAVAASPDGDVWATGSYHTSGGGRLLGEHRLGGSWQAVRMPPLRTPHAPEPGLASLSPLDGGDIWASGWYLDDDGLVEQPLVAHWDGGAWRLVPTPQVGLDSWLAGIAAVSENDVWAVGGWDSCG